MSPPRRSCDGKRNPSSRPPIGRQKRAAFGQSIARLHYLSSAAVTTLGKVMDAGTPPATKVRAADSILNHTSEAIETEDIEARIAELERATEASRKKQ